MIVASVILMTNFAAAENRALIIGVGKYSIENASLPGIGQDVENMVKIARQIGFSENQIKVLRDENATLANIENALTTWLIQGVKPSDRVLIYFSGHASYIPDENGDEDEGTNHLSAGQRRLSQCPEYQSAGQAGNRLVSEQTSCG